MTAVLEVDLAALAAALGRRLRDAGLPVTHERSARFARAVALVAPRTRERALLDGARGLRLLRGPAADLRPRVRRRFRPRLWSPMRSAATRTRRRSTRRRASARRAAAARSPCPAMPVSPAGAGCARRAAPSGDDPTRARSRCRWRWPARRSGCAKKSFDALEPHELARLRRLMAAARAGDAAPAHAPRRAAHDAASGWTCAGRCARACGPGGDPMHARAQAHGAPARDGWCCSATSPARWSPTRAPTCSC